MQGATAGPRVVPRVMVEMQTADMVAMLQQPEEAIRTVVNEVVKQGYDGIVSVWGAGGLMGEVTAL